MLIRDLCQASLVAGTYKRMSHRISSCRGLNLYVQLMWQYAATCKIWWTHAYAAALSI